MRAVVQRVRWASVAVEGDVVGRIGVGLCVLVGVGRDDSSDSARKLARRLAGLRVFDDRSVAEVGGGLLVVSQFTLYADTSRGRRPSWAAAAPAEQAEPLIELVVEELRSAGLTVATGRFGARMVVELANDGPVTLLLET